MNDNNPNDPNLTPSPLPSESTSSVAPPNPPTNPPADPATSPAAPSTPSASPPPAAPAGDVFEGSGPGRYRVKILPDKCIGAASCVAVASKAFRLNSQQIVTVLPTITEESDENLLLAAQSCPTMAIEVYDNETGQKVWPK